MKAEFTTVSLLGFFCSFATATIPKWDPRSLSWGLNFHQDGVIIVTSGPIVNEHYLQELATEVERHLPTRTNAWQQIVEWGSAIENLRKEDLKVARAHLSTVQTNFPVRITENDEFQLHFHTDVYPSSCSEAKSAVEDVLSRVSESSVTRRIRLSFSDHHAITEDSFFMMGHGLRCHRDLLKAAVASHFREPQIGVAVPFVGMNDRFNIIWPEARQQTSEGFLTSLPQVYFSHTSVIEPLTQ